VHSRDVGDVDVNADFIYTGAKGAVALHFATMFSIGATFGVAYRNIRSRSASGRLNPRPDRVFK
jgi:hypothetical protein